MEIKDLIETQTIQVDFGFNTLIKYPYEGSVIGFSKTKSIFDF